MPSRRDVKDSTIGSEGKPFKHLNLNLVKQSAREMEILSGKDPGIVMHPQDLKRLQRSSSGQGTICPTPKQKVPKKTIKTYIALDEELPEPQNYSMVQAPKPIIESRSSEKSLKSD